jgi:cell division protease FtsH
MALGYTMGLPTEDRYLQSKSEFEDKIAGMLAGNVAERIMFGDTTTGSSNDIEKATNLARRMVTEFGMSEKLGPLAFGKREEMIFLGREIGEQRNYSDEIARQIDDEVRAIIDRAYVRATEVLTTYKDRLTELAEALVAKETIEADEFAAMFADLPDPRNEPGGSPTPKLAGPLGLPAPTPEKRVEGEQPATPPRAAPGTSPQPA